MMVWLHTDTSINNLVLAALDELVGPNSEYAKDVNLAKILDPISRMTRELHPAYMTLLDPRQRVLALDKRKGDIRATIAETLWVLSGRTRIKSLLHFMPRAKDFSDDGVHWRAAYGGRIFRSQVPESIQVVDQFKFVYDVLSQDITSRQAVMTLWNPALESDAFYRGGTKDYPCSNHIQFMVREGKLSATLTMRSNDILWGFSHINCFEFTVMQELLANSLDVELGHFNHHAVSLHIYEVMYDRAKEILSSNNWDPARPTHTVPKMTSTSKESLMSVFEPILKSVEDDVEISKKSVINAFKHYTPEVGKLPSTEFCWAFCLLFSCCMTRNDFSSGVDVYMEADPDLEYLDMLSKTNYFKALAYTAGIETDKFKSMFYSK